MTIGMMRVICFLLAAIAVVAIPGAEPPAGNDSVQERLQWFLGDEERNKTLLPLIDQLDADSFTDREAATAKLAELPSLPAFLRRMAATDPRPEVRTRLTELAKLRPVENETAELNTILKRIAGEGVRGTLGTLSRIIRADAWIPDPKLLEQAARATVTEKDLPLLHDSIASPMASLRQLAAAAYSGLPPAHSTAPLRNLLDDADDAIALLAASELARRGDAASLAAFARLLGAPDFSTRHRSWTALRGLTGQSFDFTPSADAARRKTAGQKWRDWTASPRAKITGKLPESSVIALFNGHNLDGWMVLENGRPAADQTSWAVEDGRLLSIGRGRGDIRTNAAFDNYVLTLQYKVDQPAGDGGIGVMLTKENEADGVNLRGDAGSYLEVQILPERAGDLYLIGRFKAQANGRPINFSSPRTAEVDDPAGQWHTMKLTVGNGEVEVEINGTVVNRATQGSKGPGKILLRNEGHRIAYKDILIHPIEPR
jgi:hypothetical protein